MVTINLEQEQESLQREIDRLESQIAPLERRRRELRERLSHIAALLPQRNGIANVRITERINWAEQCRQHNLYVGGDSAHRVLRRELPNLHNTIPHNCVYDGRTYP
jgi:septal ring factor EnvC (AmiA/AmiB activator)